METEKETRNTTLTIGQVSSSEHEGPCTEQTAGINVSVESRTEKSFSKSNCAQT